MRTRGRTPTVTSERPQNRETVVKAVEGSGGGEVSSAGVPPPAPPPSEAAGPEPEPSALVPGVLVQAVSAAMPRAEVTSARRRIGGVDAIPPR